MEVASDCEPIDYTQIQLGKRQSPSELNAAKKTSLGAKMLSPAFSATRTWTFGTRPFQPENEWLPKFLEYTKESARMASFKTWPKQMMPKPEELVKAGFFYEGVSDTCRCFFCGVIVHSWETYDDALAEHCRHSPKCHFVEFQM